MDWPAGRNMAWCAATKALGVTRLTEQSQALSLGAEFPPPTRDQWLKLVNDALKGAPFEKRLVSKTYDGLRIEPLYARDPHAIAVAGRAPAAPWQIIQRIDPVDPALANAEAREELDNGASGLALVFSGAIGAYGFGLEPSEAAIERALEGVHLDAGIALELDLGLNASKAAAIVADIVRRRGNDTRGVSIRFGFDPIGAAAAAGWQDPSTWNEQAPGFAADVKMLSEAGFAGPHAAADGRVIHAAGGSEAQELAFVLAAALAYLRALEAGGIALEAARSMIFFRLAADADQFLTIAKFRALRMLWARVEQACGLEPRPAFIAAETAWRMMTRRDPWVNMLRAAIAAFSAGLGGANAVTALPFTAALGLPDRFARRVARNTQLILIEESNLAKVADPAAGAGGYEDLTKQLCRAAWSLFQEIERAGGAAAALAQGLIQDKVAAVRAERERTVALRKEPLTGTSEFAHLTEAPVSVLEAPRAAPPSPTGARPLAPFRLAEPFEALREASDLILARTGARPKIFLANLGPISAFNGRAMFAKSFFEAGGVEAVTNDGFATVPSPLAGEGTESSAATTDLSALVAAFKASGAKLACLCSSDAVYAREAAEAARALAGCAPAHIYLAGRPGELDASLRNAGVQTFIFAGCDVVATLKAAHAMLGSDGAKADQR